jgi:hypothetical protein
MRTLTALVVASALALGLSGSALASKGASCKDIKAALASGKSADDVATDLKTTSKHVQDCQAPAKKHKKAKKQTSDSATH